MNYNLCKRREIIAVKYICLHLFRVFLMLSMSYLIYAKENNKHFYKKTTFLAQLQ